MTGYLVSLLMGLAVGAAYGLVQVNSPAPPLIALLGLLGMVVGEQGIDMARRQFFPPPAPPAIVQPATPADIGQGQPQK